MSAAVEHPLVEPQQSVPLQEASVVDTKPETTPAVAEEKPADATEAAVPAEEAPKTEGEPLAAAPVEEKKEEKPTEPIYSGALGYKAPGLKK